MRKGKMALATVTSVFLLAGLLVACSDDNDNNVPATEPLVLGSPTGAGGNFWYKQSVPMRDTDTFEYFPGQANVWDLGTDLSLGDGGDDQFDGGVYLTVDGAGFPAQSAANFNFYGPAFDAGRGVKVAAVVTGVETNYNNTGMSAIAGTYSAYLNDIYDGRLSQTLDLTGATAPVTLTWQWNVGPSDAGFTGFPNRCWVGVQDLTTGAPLAELLSVGASVGPQTLDLSAYAGHRVVLTFGITSSGYGANLIDEVSVVDAGAHQYVTNGGFESGSLSGWSTNTPAEVQNLTTAQENMSGLLVTRSFYTVPNKLWGRWVDVFENPTAADITVTVDYDSNLGSDNEGIYYLTPGTNGKALTCWDGNTTTPPDPTSSDNDRDLAFVFGTVGAVDFTSDDGLGNGNGSDAINWNSSITVPAGGRLALVNFVFLSGTDTGDTATGITTKATALDSSVQHLVNNFWTDGQYRSGMTQAQIDAIHNF